MRFDARPALVAELSRQLRNDDRIIRHTVFRRPKGEQLGVIKNEGVSPLEAVMNSGSLMGTLGDLNNLLDPQGSGGGSHDTGAASRGSGKSGPQGGGAGPSHTTPPPAARRASLGSKPPAGRSAAPSTTSSGSMDSILSLTALLTKRPGTADAAADTTAAAPAPKP